MLTLRCTSTTGIMTASWSISSTSIIALMLESILYGFYIGAFSVAIYLHLHAQFPLHSTRTVMLLFGAVMLCLSSIHLFVDCYKLFHYCSSGVYNPSFDLALAMVYNTNNLLADCLIAYRCHVVWQNPVISLSLVSLILASATYGYIFPISNGFLGLILGTNLLVASLTAGRIWLIARRVKDILDTPATNYRLYRTAMAIVVESGFIYSLSLVALLLSSNLGADPMGRRHTPLELPGVGPGFVIVYGIVSQLVGVVPMMIIVRVGIQSARFVSPRVTSVRFNKTLSTSFPKAQRDTIIQFPETAARASVLSSCFCDADSVSCFQGPLEVKP